MKSNSLTKKPSDQSKAQFNAIFKITLIGNSSVGKTSIVKRFIDNNFSASSESTIGAQFCSKTVEIYPNITSDIPVKIKLQIWDTAGEEKFRSVTPIYYKNASAVALIYDITDFQSFTSLEKWHQEVEDNFSNQEENPIIYVIVGNKSDMHSQQKVSLQDGEEFSQKKIPNSFNTQVSAKDNEGISEFFEELALRLYKQSQNVSIFIKAQKIE